MSEKLLYLDSSAIVRFVLPDPDTDALIDLLADWPERISSALARVEVSRAVRRLGRDSIALLSVFPVVKTEFLEEMKEDARNA